MTENIEKTRIGQKANMREHVISRTLASDVEPDRERKRASSCHYVSMPRRHLLHRQFHMTLEHNISLYNMFSVHLFQRIPYSRMFGWHLFFVGSRVAHVMPLADRSGTGVCVVSCVVCRALYMRNGISVTKCDRSMR